MGEYYSWVNVDKKQYIKPVDFDDAHRLFGTGFSGPLYGALCALLASDWKGDHIIHIGDYAEVPENPDNETLRRLLSGLLSWRSDMDFDGYIIEKFQNISGIFKAAEPMVRPEINWMIENDDFGEYNYYRVEREDSFRGLFCRDLYFPRYVINESRKEYFDLGEDRFWYYDTRPMPIVLSYGRDASFYKYGGYWLGDIIAVSDTDPGSEYRDFGKDVNWFERREE